MSGPDELCVGAVIVRRRFGRWFYLLVSNEDGWSLPRGRLLDGETLPEGVRRCCWQSTSLLGLRFFWGHHFFAVDGDGAEPAVHYLLAESAAGDAELADRSVVHGELEREYRWVSEPDALELLPAGLIPLLRWSAKNLSAGDAAPGIKR